MKIVKILYWVTTAFVSSAMLYTAITYLTRPEMEQAFTRLHFPAYFRFELGIAKLAGSIVLILPSRGVLKEWAYAGFVITFISAFIANTAINEPIHLRAAPVMVLLILMVSYFCRYQLRKPA